MEKTPTLTPLEALTRLRANNHQDFQHEGFTYVSDGPMGSPEETWAATAIDDEDDDNMFFTSGEAGDEVTEASTWIQI